MEVPVYIKINVATPMNTVQYTTIFLMHTCTYSDQQLVKLVSQSEQVGLKSVFKHFMSLSMYGVRVGSSRQRICICDDFYWLR